MKTIQQFLQKPWLYIVIIIIGVLSKFYGVDHRFFWYDEVCTIEHTSGNQIFDSPPSELTIPVNKIKNISFYKDKLRLRKQNFTICSELKGLFTSTNLNPLHYTFLMFWYRIVGDKIIHFRMFSVFIFLITLPFLFLLISKLFNSGTAGWIAVCLYSCSPYFHFFAQEARYIILWTFLLILLHLLFLNAITKDKIKWWIGYTLIGILSLYASILSGLICTGHFIYLLIIRRKLWLKYFISSIFIFLGYLPWLLSIIRNSSEITTALAWHSLVGADQSFLTLIIVQLVLMAASFVSIGGFYNQLAFFSTYELQGNVLNLCIAIVLIILIIYSIVYAIKKLPKKGWLFLVLIFLPQFLFFIASDVIRNSGGSMVYRYQAMTFTAILFFVVFLFSYKIESGRIFYAGLLIAVIIFGFISIGLNSRNRCWDTPLHCEEIIQGIQLTSPQEKTLVISDYSKLSGLNFQGFLTMIAEYKSDNIDFLLATPDIENIKDMLVGKEYSDIYLTYASEDLVENFKINFGEQLDSLEIEGILPTWQIKFSNPEQ